MGCAYLMLHFLYQWSLTFSLYTSMYPSVRINLVLLITVFFSFSATAQERLFTFGEVIPLEKSLGIHKTDIPNQPINWINVNTEKATWEVRDSILVCKGLPIGVARSEREFENYILHVEWRHMEPGGNSGMFMWSSAVPGENRLPDGVEVQMLELDWVKLNKRNGAEPPIAYVHGELFGTGGVVTTPDNPRGERSKSVENRCKGRGEWNSYEVVCVDGVIKLSVNGKFVNGISQSTQRKGYMCLESEGAEIEFRNLRVIEMPGGLAKSVMEK